MVKSPLNLPYFDGDYWPNQIEDSIREVINEEEERKKNEAIQAAQLAEAENDEEVASEDMVCPFFQSLLSKIHIEDFQLYATGENVLTLTSYSGYDPEANREGGDVFSRGLDELVYPQSRRFIFGLNLTL